MARVNAVMRLARVVSPDRRRTVALTALLIALPANAAVATDNASLVALGRGVPTLMTAGDTVRVEVHATNTGTSTWTSAAGYELGTHNSHWGIDKVKIPVGLSVAPGATHKFIVRIIGPTTPGNYAFKWQMRRGASWFGRIIAETIAVDAALTDNASFVSYTDVPTSMTAGETATVGVTMRNTGTSTWTDAGGYRLVSQSTPSGLWGHSEAALPAIASVAPGATHPFIFSITAPSTPGDHTFQWRMDHEGTFGWPTTSRTITTTPANEPPVVVLAIDDVTLTVGGPSETVILSSHFQDPEQGELTYWASSADPAVVTAAIAEGVLTVTAVAAGTADVTVTASDPLGSTSEPDVFTVNAVAPVPPSAPQLTGAVTGQTQTLTWTTPATGGWITRYQLQTRPSAAHAWVFTGAGTPSPSSHISPSVRSWSIVTPWTLVRQYQVRATNAGGNGAWSNMVELTTPPELVLPYIPNFHVPAGGTVNTLFPAATGGTPPYTYSVLGLPPGITFAPSTRIASGTLPDVDVATTYTITYTVTDSASQSDLVTFTATVAPPLFLPYIPNFVVPAGGIVSTLFDAATGGTPPYTYSLSDLPPGITFDDATRIASGTLPDVDIATTYTITYAVTDSGGWSYSRTFTATVFPPLFLPYIPNFYVPAGGVVSTLFDAATGGIPPYTYSLTGLPPGITFAPSTRIASGTLPNVNVATTYTITYAVTDSRPGSYSRTFTATVAPPLFLPYIPNFVVPSGGVVSTLFDAATGGTPPYTYGLTGLPPGITFNAATRTASGTLPDVDVATTYTITYAVSDSGGWYYSRTFTVTVNP